MVERYCVPISFPCLFKVVGSWVAKKTVSKSRNDIYAGSYSIRTTSAWPVRPEHTSSYVGGFCGESVGGAPAYPDVTETTPFSVLKTASVHQKQPPPKTATLIEFWVVSIWYTYYFSFYISSFFRKDVMRTRAAENNTVVLVLKGESVCPRDTGIPNSSAGELLYAQ